MNIDDQNTLTEKWHFETNCLNERIDDAFKKAQDDAYELGLKRGKQDIVTCLWAKSPRDPELMETECGELHLINITNDKDFKFCPYCGRAINSLDKPYNKPESV